MGYRPLRAALHGRALLTVRLAEVRVGTQQGPGPERRADATGARRVAGSQERPIRLRRRAPRPARLRGPASLHARRPAHDHLRGLRSRRHPSTSTATRSAAAGSPTLPSSPATGRRRPTSPSASLGSAVARSSSTSPTWATTGITPARSSGLRNVTIALVLEWTRRTVSLGRTKSQARRSAKERQERTDRRRWRPPLEQECQPPWQQKSRTRP